MEVFWKAVRQRQHLRFSCDSYDARLSSLPRRRRASVPDPPTAHRLTSRTRNFICILKAPWPLCSAFTQSVTLHPCISQHTSGMQDTMPAWPAQSPVKHDGESSRHAQSCLPPHGEQLVYNKGYPPGSNRAVVYLLIMVPTSRHEGNARRAEIRTSE